MNKNFWGVGGMKALVVGLLLERLLLREMPRRRNRKCQRLSLH